MLKTEGTIIELSLTGTPSRYDGNCQPHDHFRCIKCGHLSNIEGREKGDLNRSVPQDYGFEVLGYRLEFYGFCSDCKRCNG